MIPFMDDEPHRIMNRLQIRMRTHNQLARALVLMLRSVANNALDTDRKYYDRSLVRLGRFIERLNPKSRS